MESILHLHNGLFLLHGAVQSSREEPSSPTRAPGVRQLADTFHLDARVHKKPQPFDSSKELRCLFLLFSSNHKITWWLLPHGRNLLYIHPHGFLWGKSRCFQVIFRDFSVVIHSIYTLYLTFCGFLLSWCYHGSIKYPVNILAIPSSKS